MRIDPRRLLVLHTVAESGGVVAAGRSLHLAPSGVSQHLAALERETGLVLLDRSLRGGQRPVQLTIAGRRLAEHAARVAELLAAAEADVDVLSGRVDGPVSLAAFPTVIRRLVVPAMLQLGRTHPGIRPAVFELDEAPALRALNAGEIDVALTEDDALRPRGLPAGLQRLPLLDDPYRLAVPTAWRTAGTVADCADRPWVDGPEGSAVRRVLDRLRRTTGLPLVGAHSCLEFPAALSLVDAGLAVALVPELALTDAVPPGVQVHEVPALGARSVSAVHRPRSRSQRPSVLAVLDALTQASQARPAPRDA